MQTKARPRIASRARAGSGRERGRTRENSDGFIHEVGAPLLARLGHNQAVLSFQNCVEIVKLGIVFGSVH
jgi:hypothetical protein